MARALLTSPRLLLMDEPLSALDVTSKKEILPYLEHLHDELAIPVLYVSHSPEEVARITSYNVCYTKLLRFILGAAAVMSTALPLSGASAEEIHAAVAANRNNFV